MLLSQLVTLGPEFRLGERYLNGIPIDWGSISYPTMCCVRDLRQILDEPIYLIRGAHPDQPTAIDACCPSVPLSQVFLALTRMQGCSWGVYSGGSFHVDTRPFTSFPARWMAVKEEDADALYHQGLAELETSRKNGWIYLTYSHARSFAGLSLVLDLAENQRLGNQEADRHA